MKISELRSAIVHAQGLLAAAGSTASAKELASLDEILARYSGRDANEAIDELAADILNAVSIAGTDRRGASRVTAYLERLVQVGPNFEMAKSVIAEIERDQNITKADLDSIATAYAGVASKLKTKTQCLAALSTRALEIARAASQEKQLRSMTPW